jgi:hypothetical protein
MRKSLSLVFLSIFFILLFINGASATPIVFTIEGQISSIPFHFNDNAGILAEQGMGTGSNVSYTFLFDYERDGYEILNDGSIETFIDGTGGLFSSKVDYFFAKLLCGTRIPEKDGGYYNDAQYAAEKYFGVRNGGPDAECVLVTGSQDSFVRLDWPVNYQNWMDGIITPGDIARIQWWGYDSLGNSSWFRIDDMTVTNVAKLTPVPEPETILCLLFGIASFSGIIHIKRISRKTKRRQ